MRILLVNWNDRENPHAGGAEIHLHEIFGRLARAGHRIDLVASGWPGASPEATIDGMRVRRVGGRNSFALRGRREARRLLASGGYDIVVEDINKVPLFLASATRLPFCVIIPHLFGTTAFAEASWPVAAVVWAAERPIPWAYRRAAFHAISDSTKADLVTRGVPADRVTVIYPGVDAAWYRPDPAVRRAARPTFLYVGRLKRYKGVEYAVRAVAAARAAGTDLALEIAGKGDDRPRLEALVRALGLGDAVRFLGFVADDEKRRLLRTAWGVVFPSPKEGWGITNVEAAACGTPAVASDSPGLRESVRDGETGYLVPHGDVAALTARLDSLARDPAAVERLGRGGRRFAEGLTWERAAQETERHLTRTIEGGRSSGESQGP
ncbi:MAG TPA: glycosyltransferase family 4 protein [Gemmatimonadales bacterium]|nr:glycosyltransferase family 4 protein [Gemmatimonadales bacterium]